MKITFFSSRMDMRVARLALAAKEVGIDLQLIAPAGTSPWQLPVPCPFSEIVTYSMDAEFPSVLQNMHAFGTNVVHAFSCFGANEHMVALCEQCRLPIVGDAYDMLTTQYVSTLMHETFMSQLSLERKWLAQVDALCLRSRYVRLLHKANSYHVGKQVIFLPEPCESKLALQRPKFSRHGGVHILFMLDYSLAQGAAGYFLDILRACQGLSIYWHILEWPHITVPENLRGYLKKKFPGIQYHNYMEVDKYMELMARVDIVTQSLDFHLLSQMGKYHKYNLEAAPYFFSNKINEVIECDSIYLIPDYFRAQAQYAHKGQRGITFAYGQLADKNFWCSLPQRIAEIHAVTPSFSGISTRYQGQRLRRFYDKILTGHQARTQKNLPCLKHP